MYDMFHARKHNHMIRVCVIGARGACVAHHKRGAPVVCSSFGPDK